MLNLLYFVIGVTATLCAAPLLLLLGGMSLAAVIGFFTEIEFDLLVGGLVGALWCWAGFTGLSGYWRWIDLHSKELSEQDIQKLKAIQHKGIWGVLAFLPISPAFSWFVIPIFCFIIAIFLDIRNKMDRIKYQAQAKSDIRPT
jgi:hypothetical protein